MKNITYLVTFMTSLLTMSGCNCNWSDFCKKDSKGSQKGSQYEATPLAENEVSSELSTTSASLYSTAVEDAAKVVEQKTVVAQISMPMNDLTEADQLTA